MLWQALHASACTPQSWPPVLSCRPPLPACTVHGDKLQHQPGTPVQLLTVLPNHPTSQTVFTWVSDATWLVRSELITPCSTTQRAGGQANAITACAKMSSSGHRAAIQVAEYVRMNAARACTCWLGRRWRWTAEPRPGGNGAGKPLSQASRVQKTTMIRPRTHRLCFGFAGMHAQGHCAVTHVSSTVHAEPTLRCPVKCRLSAANTVQCAQPTGGGSLLCWLCVPVSARGLQAPTDLMCALTMAAMCTSFSMGIQPQRQAAHSDLVAAVCIWLEPAGGCTGHQ